MIEAPEVRPGAVHDRSPMPRVIAFFHAASQGNPAIQVLTGLGAPNNRPGVTPPEGIEGGQGMVPSIACPEPLRARVEAACRSLGGEVHRQPT